MSSSLSASDPNHPPLSTFFDSGAPQDRTDYTTIVLVHGLTWHGANFRKLLPLASSYNARVVAVNRRGYPGSAPVSVDDMTFLERAAQAPEDDPVILTGIRGFWRARARELFEYLVALVNNQAIPATSSDDAGAKGGIVLVGWSFGSVWTTAFLAHLDEFTREDAQLRKYLRRVVIYDGSYYFFGYPSPPANIPQPLMNSINPSFAERVHAFEDWVTSYYEHTYPVTAEGLARTSGSPLTDPPATNKDEESQNAPPGELHAADFAIVKAMRLNVYAALKDGAFYPAERVAGGTDRDGPEVRILWCDRSIWEPVWGAHVLSEELKLAQAEGKMTRDITFARFRDANHFAHWDSPEKTLKMFLKDRRALT